MNITADLSIPAEAHSRFSTLSTKEVEKGRVIGGDLSDLRFWGYSVENGVTTLASPELTRVDESWTQDDINSIARAILMESFASIGTECVEHS